MVPFLTAGYSRLFDEDDGVNAWNVGGGLHYWFSRHAGLRLEFRDHIHTEDRDTAHLWGARFGISFR